MVMSGQTVNLTAKFLGKLRPPKQLTLLQSERPKLYGVLAPLSAIVLTSTKCTYFFQGLTTVLLESGKDKESISMRVRAEPCIKPGPLAL